MNGKTIAKVMLGLVVIALLIWGGWANLFTTKQYVVNNDCPANGCNGGYLCLQGTTENICVTEQFYMDYWTIYNRYGYKPCKLTIVGDYAANDTFISFFAITLKECDMLKWSCSNSTRYNADCTWDNNNSNCVCFTKPAKQ